MSEFVFDRCWGQKPIWTSTICSDNFWHNLMKGQTAKSATVKKYQSVVDVIKLFSTKS